jgi:hypothetical protein
MVFFILVRLVLLPSLPMVRDGTDKVGRFYGEGLATFFFGIVGQLAQSMFQPAILSYSPLDFEV